jgi:phosphoglycerate dehydrogenase-like enzyme
VVMAMQDLPFLPDHWRKLEAAVAPDTLIRADRNDVGGLDRALATAEIAILAGDLDARHTGSPSLKWIHCDHAGLTRSARPEVFEKDLIVTGSAGRSAEALAEHAMMFALLLCSRYADFYEAQRRHAWHRSPEMAKLRALKGRTMGIIGLGNTGVALAARASAFGMSVLGYRRRDLPAPPGVERVYSTDRGETIDPILAEADVLALVVNLSDATQHLIGTRELALMKPSAVLINLSRGGVIDQDALITALSARKLAGAGLDVTTPEPLPPGHPLWDAPNVLITPHFTASLPDRTDRSLDMIIENLRRYRAGEPMLNRITREDIYTQSDPIRSSVSPSAPEPARKS